MLPQCIYLYNIYVSHYSQIIYKYAMHTGTCPGGARPPPIEIEKQIKGPQSKFSAISPIFCYFFSWKYNFLCYFLSWAPLKN